MSEPLWCPIRQHYCRCQDFGKRCDDFDEEPVRIRGVLYRNEDDAYDALVQREVDGE